MGSSGSVPVPKQVPDAASVYGNWLEGYTGQSGNRLAAEMSDLDILNQLNTAYNQNQLGLAQAMTPEYINFITGAQQDYGSRMNDWYLSEAARLGDAYKTASMDPQAAKIMALYGDQVYDDLAAGGGLSADENRTVEQAVRAAQMNRGLTHGNTAEFQEAVQKTLGSQNLKNQRQSNANAFLQLQKATQGDPLSFVMGTAGSNANGIYNPENVNYTGASALTPGAMSMDNENNNIWNQLQYNVNALNAQRKDSSRSGIGSAIGMGGGYLLGGLPGMMIGGSMGSALA